MGENAEWVKHLKGARRHVPLALAAGVNPILGVLAEDWRRSGRRAPHGALTSMIAFDRRRLVYLALSIVASVLVLAATRGPVRAASHTFILPSSSGYGVSDCLGKSQGCDEIVASAWCESQGYAHPLAYGRIEDAVTAKIPLVPGQTLAPPPGQTLAKSDPNAYVVTCGD